MVWGQTNCSRGKIDRMARLRYTSIDLSSNDLGKCIPSGCFSRTQREKIESYGVQYFDPEQTFLTGYVDEQVYVDTSEECHLIGPVQMAPLLGDLEDTPIAQEMLLPRVARRALANHAETSVANDRLTVLW